MSGRTYGEDAYSKAILEAQTNGLIFGSEMSDDEFGRFSELIQTQFGIRMPPTKKVLLQSRFQRRLRALGMRSYGEYCDYVFSQEGMENEWTHLVDVVTTNTTHFLREPKHFEILVKEVLPEFLRRTRGAKKLKLWSAGCSSGEEPYTLAMVMSEFARVNPSFDFSILATDISQEVLDLAAHAVYPLDKGDEIPMEYKQRYMLISKDRSRGLMKMNKAIRSKVTFKRLNFMKNFKIKDKPDIIFCRNVVIYFDREIQTALFQKFCQNLDTDGYLFIGHSESLSGMQLPLRPVVHTVFQKVG